MTEMTEGAAIRTRGQAGRRWNGLCGRLLTRLLVVLTLGATPGCGDGSNPTPPPGNAGPLPSADVKVLFVGNSLTFFNDLPSRVQTIAEAAGHTLSKRSFASANFSLQEHWQSGIAREIREARADVVVLQQGPSTLPQNQEHLKSWSETLAPVIREAGGRPALFMVWPSRARLSYFGDVRTSYANAAEAVDGIFIPAGQAWLSAWDRDESLALYGPDGFHPSELGSTVAALTIYRMLFDEPVTELPITLQPSSSGLPRISILPETAELVYAAVEEAVARWGRR